MPQRQPKTPALAVVSCVGLGLFALAGSLPSAEAAEAPDFVEVRRMLLAAAGPEVQMKPRVWTHPTPVEDESLYRIRFEAQCDCQALLFSVDGSSDQITLLYPNPYEPSRRLVAGERLEIPSTDDYTLRAVGGAGLDILKLFVTGGSFGFPRGRLEAWRATPADPGAVAELAAFLAGLEGTAWATAAAPLQIVR